MRSTPPKEATLNINLNADLGESFGAWTMGDDRALLGIVGSANVACGFHAGDPLVMTETVRLAREAGVSIGAHPAFPDLQGFGRRAMRLSARELGAVVTYQVGALIGVAQAQGLRVTHVKPHGAMNNLACEDAAMAATIAGAVKAIDTRLILLAPALSQLAVAGRAAGLRVADEIFADRAYTDEGNLVPRGQPGAVLCTSIVQHRAGLAARDEVAFVGVGAIGKDLVGNAQSRGASRDGELR